MNERDFCYWLKGYFELTYDNQLTADQIEIIREHLNLVFDKETELVLSHDKYPKRDGTNNFFDLQKQNNGSSDTRVVSANHLEVELVPHLTC